MSIAGTTPMTVNPQTVASSLASDLRSQQAAIATAENQVATGIAVPTPSSDPVKAVEVLQLDSQVSRAGQYSANAQDGLDRLALANTTLSSVVSTLQQVTSSVESLAGLTRNPGVVASVATSVTDASSELMGLANTQYDGQAIFSGTGTPKRAYTATGKYVGAGTAPTATVAKGTQVAVSVLGPAVFGPTGPGSLFGKTGVLATIVAELSSGTATSIEKATTTGLTALQTALSRAESQASQLGAAQQSMQDWANRASGAATALTQQLSDVRDVTMAEAVTNLQSQQATYQAALYVASQLHTDSLVDYL